MGSSEILDDFPYNYKKPVAKTEKLVSEKAMSSNIRRCAEIKVSTEFIS